MEEKSQAYAEIEDAGEIGGSDFGKTEDQQHRRLDEDVESSMTTAPPTAELHRFFSAPVGAFIHLSKGSSMRGTIFNLINTVIGGGILALPQALEYLGVVPGVFLMIFVALCTDVTISFVLHCIDSIGAQTYAEIAQKLYGKSVKIGIDVNTFLLSFGICTSYVVIVSSLLQDFFEFVAPSVDILSNRTAIICVMAPCVFLPLSSMSKLDSLRYVSFFCLTFLITFCVIVGIVAVGADPNVHVPSGGDIKLIGTKPLKAIESLPVIFFAFVCHMNVPTLYEELRRMSPQTAMSPSPVSKYVDKRAKMIFTVRVALLTCLLLYVVAAVCGYIAFGDQLDDNVLQNFQRKFGGILSAAPYFKLIYALLLSFSFPTLCYSAIRCSHRLLYEVYKANRQGSWVRTALSCLFPNRSRQDSDYVAMVDESGDVAASAALSKNPVVDKAPRPLFFARVVEAFCIIGSASIVGITCTSITTVFSLTGSVTCSTIMFILPGFFYMKVKENEGADMNSLDVWTARLSAYGGIVVGIVCTSIVILNIAMGN